MAGVIRLPPWAGLSSMPKWELLVGNSSSRLTFTTLCAAGLSLDTSHSCHRREKKKPFWLRFPYTPKPNEQNGFHLPALATLPCSTCFPLCCGFSRHYRPLPSLLLLHQSIPQTDNLTCSAFHGAHVLSPRALCGLTAQRLANIVLAWPWNGKVRSATLLIFTHKHTCTFLPHNHTCMCIDCVHTLRCKHYRLFTTRNTPLDWNKQTESSLISVTLACL